MKTIKFLVATLLAFTIYSCETDSEEEIESILEAPSGFEAMLDEYGLLDTGVKYESYSQGIDTNLIYFNGQKDNRLCIEGLEVVNKKRVLSWRNDVELKSKYIEDKGYGESSIHHISYFRIIRPYSFNDYNTFILWGYEDSLNQQRIISSDLYFISNNNYKRVESITYPSDAYFIHDLTPWFEDKIIVTKVFNDYGKTDSCFCYSMKGDELFSFEKSEDFFPKEDYIVVEVSKYIEFTGGVQGAFVCNNIKETKELWKSEKPLNDLPDDTRVDKIELSKYNFGSILCKFNYTLYSGETGVRDVIIDIETGQEVEK